MMTMMHPWVMVMIWKWKRLKNNTNVIYTGNDLQLHLVELVGESIMSQKSANTERMDGTDVMVDEEMLMKQ